MKIALIGGTGYVGSKILAEALRRGHKVTAIVRHPQRLAGMSFFIHRDEHGKLLVCVTSDKLFHIAAAPPFQGFCSQFTQNPAAALS